MGMFDTIYFDKPMISEKIADHSLRCFCSALQEVKRQWVDFKAYPIRSNSDIR